MGHTPCRRLAGHGQGQAPVVGILFLTRYRLPGGTEAQLALLAGQLRHPVLERADETRRVGHLLDGLTAALPGPEDEVDRPRRYVAMVGQQEGLAYPALESRSWHAPVAGIPGAHVGQLGQLLQYLADVRLHPAPAVEVEGHLG